MKIFKSTTNNYGKYLQNLMTFMSIYAAQNNILDRFIIYNLTYLDADMAGIPPQLLNRLRNVLLECEQFESDRKLRAIFAYEPLSPWRYIDIIFPKRSAQSLKEGARKRIKEKGVYPFANPFYWAAFITTGF